VTGQAKRVRAQRTWVDGAHTDTVVPHLREHPIREARQTSFGGDVGCMAWGLCVPKGHRGGMGGVLRRVGRRTGGRKVYRA
jgi:hypothetical protein